MKQKLQAQTRNAQERRQWENILTSDEISHQSPVFPATPEARDRLHDLNMLMTSVQKQLYFRRLCVYLLVLRLFHKKTQV